MCNVFGSSVVKILVMSYVVHISAKSNVSLDNKNGKMKIIGLLL